MYWHSGNNCGVATLPKSYPSTTGISIQSLKLIGQLQHVYINNMS